MEKAKSREQGMVSAAISEIRKITEEDDEDAGHEHEAQQITMSRTVDVVRWMRSVRS